MAACSRFHVAINASNNAEMITHDIRAGRQKPLLCFSNPWIPGRGTIRHVCAAVIERDESDSVV